jgi:hypothetical protein
MTGSNKLLAPLASRKVKAALATVIAAYLAQFVPYVTEELVYTILGVGTAYILGVAHEDNGAKSAPKVTELQPVEQVVNQPLTREQALELLEKLKAFRDGKG